MDMACVDNAFQMTRRLIAAFVRPLGTSSSQHAAWQGYELYNPVMTGKYLTVFRAVANFISVGPDGKTPAMRLGLAKQPLTYEDILGPGETAAAERPLEGEAAQRATTRVAYRNARVGRVPEGCALLPETASTDEPRHGNGWPWTEPRQTA